MDKNNSDLARAMVPVALELLGNPNPAHCSTTELRWGNNGSLCVDKEKGTWCDFADSGRGGGVLALLKAKRGFGAPEALQWMRDHKFLPPTEAKAKSKSRGPIEAIYDYLDADGTLLFQVVRNRNPKAFWQRVPDGNGGWLTKLSEVKRVVYRLPQVIAAVETGTTIFVVEGEKAVHALETIGLIGTCAPMGAGRWKAAYDSVFAGADVVILPDNDPQSTNQDGSLSWHDDGRPVLTGQDHADVVASHLLPVAKRVRVVMLPGLPLKGDVVDWLAAGGTTAELEKLVASASYPPQRINAPPAANTNGAASPRHHQLDQILDAAFDDAVIPQPNGRDKQPLGQDDADHPVMPEEEGWLQRTIRVENGCLEEAVTKGELALIETKSGIYQRGPFIVRPGIVRIAVSGGRKIDAQRILQLGESGLLEAMTSACKWQQHDGRSQRWVAKDCPLKVVKALRDRVGRWKLPVLAGIINAPTLRADGSILDTPGYDEQTNLLFDPQGATFPVVPAYPVKDEARAALEVLKGLISQFPFVENPNGSARSVALSAMLTEPIRHALRAAPMHCFDAPAAGTGKSKLVDIACVITTGREAAVIAQGRTEEEFEKRLGSMLLAGEPGIAIDNCEHPLGGEFLCQVLTQSMVKARILGKSETPDLPSSAFITATANNLTLIGDVTRRAITSKLDAEMERPELRVFAEDPVDLVKADRPKYLVAALTVLRAFHVAGRPKQKNPLGSYEDWSHWVRDALIWLGEADPVDTMEAARDGDPKLSALRSVLTQWHSVLENESVTMKALVDRATELTGDREAFVNPDFREALLVVAGIRGAIDSDRLGKWLRNNKDRVVNGLCFRRDTINGPGGAAKWAINSVHQNAPISL